MHQQMALSPPTLRFLQPINYWKEAKKMVDKNSCKMKKEKETV